MEVFKNVSNNDLYEQLRSKLNELYTSNKIGSDSQDDNSNKTILELSQYMDELYNQIC